MKLFKIKYYMYAAISFLKVYLLFKHMKHMCHAFKIMKMN